MPCRAAARIQLGTPILQPLDIRHLCALCATADTLIERVARLKDVKSFDVRILQEIEACCKRLAPGKHPQVGAAGSTCRPRAPRPACGLAAAGRHSQRGSGECWACLVLTCRAARVPPGPHMRACARLRPQEVLQQLRLLEVFPHLAQGLVLGKLAPVENNPSACAHQLRCALPHEAASRNTHPAC